MLETKDVLGWHIADNTSYEPARTNNFEFMITDIDKLLKAGVDDTGENGDEDFIKDGQEIIRLSVNKASVPHMSQGELEVSRGNIKSYYAGSITFEGGTIEVVDYIGVNGKSVLMAWQRLSGDAKTGRVGRAKDYKKDCILIEYSPDYEKIRSWTLKGCWVTGLSEPDFSFDSADKKVITAKIRFDRAIPEEWM